MASDRRKEWRWHKHVFVLLVAIGTQLAQILFTLLVLLIGAAVLGGPDSPAPIIGPLAFAALVCSIWTAVHLVRELALPPPASNDRLSVSRRQAMLTRIRSPIYRTAAGLAVLICAGLAVAILAAGLFNPRLVWLPVVTYYVLLALWIMVEIVDWINDVYILREDRILDIMALPVVYQQRTEAPLVMVQNATVSQEGIGVFLDFGTVQIETAGYSRPVLFEYVWRPKLIQDIIFSQIEDLRQGERDREQSEHDARSVRWIGAYHTLTGGIRNIDADETVEAGRPVQVRWRVTGPPGRRYRTWVAWDVVSVAEGEYYAGMQRSYDRPRYASPEEFDGIGGGMIHRVHIRAPESVDAIYFRVAVAFRGEQIVYSSPERVIQVLHPL